MFSTASETSIAPPDATLTPEQLQRHLKRRCEQDFQFFCRVMYKHVYGYKFIRNYHFDVICDHLMLVYHGAITHLLVNIPPRYGKTEVIIILFTAWCYARNPSCSFIHLSYSSALALENSDKIKRVINSELYQQLWPHMTIKRNKDAKERWDTVENGTFYATSTGGQITGMGAGHIDDFSVDKGFCGAILIDDPLKPDDAHSDVRRETINDRWDNTIKSRFNSRRTPCITVGQRIHERDFSQMLLEHQEYKFHHLVLPAILDEGTSYERALWPEKETLAQLQLERKSNSYVFAGQKQQKPAPLGGGIIQGVWFGRYTVVPKLRYRAMFVDTAQKKERHNDYQVALVAGVSYEGDLYILDVMRERFEAYELENKLPDFWNKHKKEKNGRLRKMHVEDKVSGTTLIQKIRNTVKPRIPVEEISRGNNQNKLTRVMDVQGYIESGYVKIPQNAEWVHDFVSECEHFQKDDSHAHDDQVDALCDAISEMLHKDRPTVREVMYGKATN